MAALAPIRPFTTHVVNPVMRPVAGMLPGFAILSYVGRRSGRAYRTPVLVFHDGPRYVFALTHGNGVQWMKNVLARGSCEIEQQGRTTRLRSPELFVDATARIAPAPVRVIFRLLRVDEFLAMTPVTT
jgi:deazaflavin-dependent oxidoreductase (nitroreductase family)